MNTRIPVIASSSPLIQQGVTLTMSELRVGRDRRHRLQLLLGALRRQRLCRDPRCDRRQVHAARGRRGQDDHRRQHRRQRRRHGGRPLARDRHRRDRRPALEDAPAALQQQRARGRRGYAITPGVWTGPTLTTDTVELMRCTNVCVRTGSPNLSSYTVANGDLGAILRVKETAANAGGATVVWSARYVGPDRRHPGRVGGAQQPRGPAAQRERRDPGARSLVRGRLGGRGGEAQARAQGRAPLPVGRQGRTSRPGRARPRSTPAPPRRRAARRSSSSRRRR